MAAEPDDPVVSVVRQCLEFVHSYCKPYTVSWSILLMSSANKLLTLQV